MARFSRIGLLSAVVGAVVVAVGAVAYNTPARLDVDVQILQASDARFLSRPNVVELQLTNRGSVYLQPVFSVEWDHYPFVWDGPSERLAPRDTRRIVIQTENYDAMPPAALTGSADESGITRSVPFVVRVNNAGRPEYWASRPWVAAIREEPIVNGDFQRWAPPDFSSHGRTPMGWDNYSSGQMPDFTRALPMEQSGVLLQVTKSSVPGASEWAEAALSRRVPVNTCPIIRMQMSEWPSYETSGRVAPVLMAGIQLFDDSAPGRTLLDVAGPESRRYGLDNGIVIWEQNPVEGALTADLREARSWIGAGNSPFVNVKIFLSVHRSASTRVASMGVRSIQCLSG